MNKLPIDIEETLKALRTQYQFCADAIVARNSIDAPTIIQLSRIREAHLKIIPILEALQESTSWQVMDIAPKDGTVIIAWISSKKGFADVTANIYYDDEMRIWRWEESDELVKRPDLIKGWRPYPQPPEQK